ncbi:hypothetical protein CC80DRAFT_282609 [Byssothecium circinans]|uniref:Uncharacterized protein n=1 Tax=Byssothecium circinans TaxID=147558 RepID=A0A6A5TA04_9PLEO|nr:hypothetical protein CC80DRAFT_282609 [Byssothecium circinans]
MRWQSDRRCRPPFPQITCILRALNGACPLLSHSRRSRSLFAGLWRRGARRIECLPIIHRSTVVMLGGSSSPDAPANYRWLRRLSCLLCCAVGGGIGSAGLFHRWVLIARFVNGTVV